MSTVEPNRTPETYDPALDPREPNVPGPGKRPIDLGGGRVTYIPIDAIPRYGEDGQFVGCTHYMPTAPGRET